MAIWVTPKLSSLPDVGISSPQDGHVLTYDSGTGEWVNEAPVAGVTDHGALTGLADDDHTQYVLLAGRAGGTTIYGGTSDNDDITIHGTSTATRTTSYVILQPSGGLVGVGTATPSVKLEVSGATAGQPSFRAYGSDPTYTTLYTEVSRYGALLVLMKSEANAPALGVSISGDTYSRISLGLDLGVPFLGFGPGSSSNRDIFMRRDSGDLTFRFGTSPAEKHRFKSSGEVGIGTTSPGSMIHALADTAATNTVTNIGTLTHNSTGTPAAGFGAGLLYSMETSTTASTSAGRLYAVWNDATHATRKADMVLTAYDTDEREGLRIRGAGSAAAIGFLGATPIARKAHVAAPSGGATVDAEARSAINSILATLEAFGFHEAESL